jgi:hypothetical protein
MSRRASAFALKPARAGFLVGMLASLVAPLGAAARQAPDEELALVRARAQAELLRLTPLLAEARSAWSAANTERVNAEARRVVNGTDTIQVGPLRVIVFDGEGEAARPYFENAWAHYSAMLDGDPLSLPQRLFAFQHGFLRRKWYLPAHVKRIELVWARPAEVQRAVNDAVGRTLSPHLPQAQRRWAGSTVGQEPSFEAVYRELVLGAAPPILHCAGCSGHLRLPRNAFSASAPLVACRQGDTDACWAAMGATGNGEIAADIALWYGDDFGRWIEPLGPGCGRDHDSYCEQAISYFWEDLPPLGDASRASLISLALEMGGRGSLVRLIETRGYRTDDNGRRILGEPIDYPEILSSAAAVGPDELMTEWLRRVQAAKPDRAGTDRDARFGAILWITLFIALAIRSTRWRLG